MEKADVSELLKRIKRVYPMFQIPLEREPAREMLNDWHEFLANVPYEAAKENLSRYVRNPENKFPPHPGILAEKPVERSESHYIPNAEETRRMLEEQDHLFASSTSSEIPESARERMRQLGYKPSGRYQ